MNSARFFFWSLFFFSSLKFCRYAAFGGEVAAFSRDLIDIYRESNPEGVVMTDDIVAPSLVIVWLSKIFPLLLNVHQQVSAALKGQARYDAIAQVWIEAWMILGCLKNFVLERLHWRRSVLVATWFLQWMELPSTLWPVFSPPPLMLTLHWRRDSSDHLTASVPFAWLCRDLLLRLLPWLQLRLPLPPKLLPE